MNKTLVFMALSLFIVLSVGVFTDVAYSEEKKEKKKGALENSLDVIKISGRVDKSIKESESVAVVAAIFAEELNLQTETQNNCLLKASEYPLAVGTMEIDIRYELQGCRTALPIINALINNDTFTFASYLLKNGDKPKAKELFRALVVNNPDKPIAKKAEFALEDMASEEKMAEEKAKTEKTAAKTKKKSKSIK